MNGKSRWSKLRLSLRQDCETVKLLSWQHRFAFWHIILLALIVVSYHTQSHAATLLPPGLNCYSTANGTPLAGGTVNFYIAGTLTPRAVWQDSGQVTAWAPTGQVALGSSSSANPGCALIYGSGVYRQIVKDSLSNTIFDQLTTSPAVAGVAWGGTSTGSANAQVITASEFVAIDGQAVAFLAGATNTGATTLATTNVAATTVVKDTSSGPVALTGSEIIANNVVEAIYSGFDGHFHLVNLLAAAAANTNFQSFTASGTWTKPSVGTGSVTHIECWGGGGGGSTAANGGGGGGGGYSDRWITTSSLGATETVTIPAAGAAGAVGGNATFGSWVTGYGGGSASGTGGSGGGGETSAGGNTSTSAGGAGGGPWSVAAATVSPSGGGGGAGGGTNAGAAGYFGGGGGGGGWASNTPGAGGASVWGGGGGGGVGSSNGAGGTSLWGGAGGAGGSAGTQPGGGGGRNAAGGQGQCQATAFP